MSLLGGGPSKKPKFAASKARNPVPLSRDSGKPASAQAAQGKPDTQREASEPKPERDHRDVAEARAGEGRGDDAPAVKTRVFDGPHEAAVEAFASSDEATKPLAAASAATLQDAAPSSLPTPSEPQQSVPASNDTGWRDSLRAEAKEMTRAANYLSSMLQQRKPVEDLLPGATKLNEQARSYVAAVTDTAETTEMVVERLNPLQKAAGALMRTADKAESPTEALAHARSKPQTAGNPFLINTLEKAVVSERAARSDTATVAPSASTPLPSVSQSNEQTTIASHQDRVLEASREQLDVVSQQRPVARERDEAAPEKRQAETESTAPEQALEAPAAVLPLKQTAPTPAENLRSEEARAESDSANFASPSEGLPGADATQVNRTQNQDQQAREAANPPAPERAKSAERPEQDAGPMSGATKASETTASGTHLPQADAAQRRSIESFLQPPPARTAAGPAAAPTAAERRTGRAPQVTAVPDAPFSPPPGEQPPGDKTVTVVSHPAPEPTRVEPQRLESVLREHMADRGFDGEAQRLAPTVASAVESNARYRAEEQALVVLHKEGERVATATTERSVSVVAQAGDSVLGARALEHISEHGLNPAVIRDIRDVAPHATGTMTSLEVADKMGAGFLARASAEGVPKQFLADLREVSVETQRQLGEQTDKAIAQRFALEHAAAQWGDERRSTEEALRSAPAAAVQMLERVAAQNRAAVVASAPVSVIDATSHNRDHGHEVEHTKKFKLSF
ncbi:hypothetical protein [Burkholderia cenocepacia]|uniref:hypothetical protein n=1 Tax=Burkholderia cenocepacia TaxID=95486 RepID=UPI00076D4FD0|nr:hypothetical protein [Burkholderia cenocepacia]KWU19181.1 hypothetical protein AS149_13110 [Burkholderia cenocepacia]